ncbi:MAG: fibronectin type III domain-containing protein [Acidimicrobiia bacterium]
MNRYLLELGVAAAVSISAIAITNGSGPVPDRPYDATATPGNESAAVAWKAPPASGTHIVTNTITASTGGQTATANGDETGASAGSSPTRLMTPEAGPAAPIEVDAIAGIERAVVSWKAPPNDGDYRISAYTVIASGGQHVTVAAPQTRATVSGLTGGAPYTFRVDATTTTGTSAVSAPSAQVVMPSGTPSAPLYLDAFAGDRAVELLWQPPAHNGGSVIANYTVTTTPRAEQITVPARRGAIPTVTIHGLTNGTRYRFTVYATNALGHSVNSAASDAVTPYGPPGAPTAVHATQHDGRVVVSWTAPANDNGSLINQYRVTASPGGMLAGIDAPHHSLTIEGLTSGTDYTFTVVALNDAANGPASLPSNAVTVGDPA